ncbi:spermidine resistance protein [Yamadazyma tenuis]|uniref:adenosylmethionine decarboxylase n=1 Tax=Candida tenuis (strain ATCC 10573 / BCRC 21748 / CBS 615 / JCM 9827 / NBRC 10315 / NRRL Y-1498 / VKM Y-70) TaxID=590646 RepID=G3B908_CANTC|nr:uncharacterized protein CANTEDRAFT_115896 [Yamadazyma tenuis ATCC 10573]XP_006689094.1 S-adenosylmethionine decarboxylase [Yamadazyma tenuis ATCC 10573]EGV62923.1 hypothetical protein CANTEDRAFT_115896 [Yamadazyma tenuis ATCC 10573]EGV62924.1 S-adenosylmethionine decarboxylase [Yamadazyma tenuis ATCC 10573]WEJ93715.1 spermidine resistance protein [Yamadazyma tenuis]
MVAPAYTDDSYVDHELSANLDSTSAFEGPEKLLEVWVWPNEAEVKSHSNCEDGLRSIPLKNWVDILDLVNCKILSMKSSKYMDAYLLSESSLFVFSHKIILKTCGTTTTLFCIEKLFEDIRHYVAKKVNTKEIFKVFYSRRSFMFPERQQSVHKDWKKEVKLLNEYFINGKSYVVGDFASDDHWYLYTGGQKDDECKAPGSIRDQTFEVLMTDLDPGKAEQFVTSRKPGFESFVKNGFEEDDLGHEFGFKTIKSTKLNSIFNDYDQLNKQVGGGSAQHLPSPKEDGGFESAGQFLPFNFVHDAFSFTPCGFSSNSISSNNGSYYYTLHITPESGWSYASFETNFPFSSISNSSINIVDVLIKILKVFRPGRFSVTLINEIDTKGDETELSELFNCDRRLCDLNYKKNERVLYDLESNYKLLYLNFEKF